jgi:hypothetical protein
VNWGIRGLTRVSSLIAILWGIKAIIKRRSGDGEEEGLIPDK